MGEAYLNIRVHPFFIFSFVLASVLFLVSENCIEETIREREMDVCDSEIFFVNVYNVGRL